MRIDETNFTIKYLSKLNEDQISAVKSTEGAILLLAVPGSGKTTTLVNRLGYMYFCKGINPKSILTLTYTVAAANDMSKRFASIFGEEFANLFEFKTINSICYRIIRMYAEKIGKSAPSLITEEKSTKLISDILINHLEEYPTESDIKEAKSLITFCKNMMLDEREIMELGKKESIELSAIFKEYNKYLKEQKMMDFDDQMIYAHSLLKSNASFLGYFRNLYKYICVDEAQDTSKIQHAIIKLLAGEEGNIFMVGDEDQSIYGFRGAYPEALLNFEKNYPNAKVLIMDLNYRSNANIVSLADSFIQNNIDRHKKNIIPTRSASSEVRFVNLNNRANQYSYLSKLASNCKVETAVLYRDNESALPLIDLLDRQGIPFRIKSIDMAFFSNRVVLDICNILKYAKDPYNTELFMKIYFKCQTYLKKFQAEQMCRVAKEGQMNVLRACEHVSGINPVAINRCKIMHNNLKKMLTESPSKALFRIENTLGYGEYLERNNIDSNKLFVLKQLASSESTIEGFLGRLSYLQQIISDKPSDYNANFILSTVHSSKGLEYDQVYLIDICDGIFPAKTITKSSTPQEKKAFEEERRLFYVGMTRARDNLCIFSFNDESSIFMTEINRCLKPNRKTLDEPKTVSKPAEKPVSLKNSYNFGKTKNYVSDYELIIGERVVQDTLGAGTVINIDYDDTGKPKRFTVCYDKTNEERLYGFPAAFALGMTLESGEEIPIEEKKSEFHRPIVKKPQVKTYTRTTGYSYWERKYPEHVIINREGAFWSCHGESAETIHDILGYKLGYSKAGKAVTGSPSLDAMTSALKRNKINFVVIDGDEIIEEE